MATALRHVGHEDRLSLVEHLTELRVRIVVCLVAFIAATGVCMWQNHAVLKILNHPLDQTVDHGNKDPLVQAARYDQANKRFVLAEVALYRQMALSEDNPATRKALNELAVLGERTAALAPEVRARRPVTLGVGEPFMETLKVAAYAGLLLSLPLILYQIYAFVLPAFSPRERQIALPAMLGVPFLFIGGVIFGYFMVLPPAIRFLQNFNTDSFDVLIQAQPYYKFVIMLLAAMGLLFQIPVGHPRFDACRHRDHAPAEEEPPLRDPRDRGHRDAPAGPGPGDDDDDDGAYVRAVRRLYPPLLAHGPARGARGRRGGGVRGGRRRFSVA